MMPDDNSLYARLSERFLCDGVERGSMMGYPCLRFMGSFFASEERGSGHLIVKLNEIQVTEAIRNGVGLPFKPAGRVFKEWLLIPEHDEAVWYDLISKALDQAKRSVASSETKTKTKQVSKKGPKHD